jgi:hypothetical protein
MDMHAHFACCTRQGALLKLTEVPCYVEHTLDICI